MKNKLFVLSVCIILSSCAVNGRSYFVRFWNGNLPCDECSRRDEVRNNKLDEYYKNESDELKVMREKNRELCWGIADKIYNNKRAEIINGMSYRGFYYHCLKNRGTPSIDYDLDKKQYYEYFEK